MKFYLKTKEQCDEIVKRNEAFIKIERFVEGCNVAIYDYRLASLSDFVNDEAFELRGYCFVERPDGSWEPNILMNKFFNVNQTDGWMYDDVKNKKIIEVSNKEDGSIISFVKFPNGKIRAKSKTSFESDQAKMAQKILDSRPILLEKLDYMLTNGETPIFELVGPDNQIVLEYHNTELVLLQIRDNDGMYLGRKTLQEKSNIMCVRLAERFNEDMMDLDTLLSIKETSQDNIEGWVVTFEDGQMAKIKTDKYIQLHGLVGPDAFRENLLIQTILDGNIDDVIAQLVTGEKKDRIIAMDEKVVHKFNHLVVEFKMLRGSYYNQYNENRKEFAIKNSKNPLFSYVMKSIGGKFSEVEEIAEKQVRTYIDKCTNSLGKAKEWLGDL